MKHTNSDQNKKTEFDISKFKLIVFQPDKEFYEKTFAEKLVILSEKIKQAKQFMEANFPGNKSLFVAPEYLFKNMSAKEDDSGRYYIEDRYYSHEQKKQYQEILKDLSKDTDMILAPGTICWGKSKQYRNMIYFFHQGEIIHKYKKMNPHALDYDYPSESPDNVDKSLFKKGESNTNTFNVNNMDIGVEVCLDTVMDQLASDLGGNPNKKLNIHLVVADGVDYINPIQQENLLFIKIEREKTKGQIVAILSDRSMSQQQSDTLPNNDGDDDLVVYHFKK